MRRMARLLLLLLAGGTALWTVGGCAKARQYQRWFEMSPAELRADIATPEHAAEFLDLALDPTHDRKIEGSDDWRSLAHLRRHREGDCDDFAVASAALLGDDGYPAKMLVVGYIRWYRDTEGKPGRRGYCHAVHLLAKDGFYGANGQIRWDRIPPQYSTIEELVRHIPLSEGRWTFYKVIELDDVDCVAGEGNLFERLADVWKQTKWIDVTYPPPATQPSETDPSP